MSGRTSAWVSKTDLTRYLRCPYAFYLLDSGLIEFDDTVTELQTRLIQEGVDFQTRVEAAVPELEVKARELPKILASESMRLFGVPVFENPALQIYGQPDAIETANGALLPVEVKSHKSVQRSDELELAFYWLLLEPHRTRPAAPRGYLLLRRNGVAEQVEVSIGKERLEQVHSLLQEVRRAREVGVQPKICACPICNGVMRNEVHRVTRANKDLTMIWDIGRARAKCLESVGIGSYEELLAKNSDSLVQDLRERKCHVSLGQIDRWKHHATSYLHSRPVLFGVPPVLGTSFIALDLEYELGSLIWLVGMCVVLPDEVRHYVFWADTPQEEEAGLKQLAEILNENPSLPVVTWSGTGADVPQLRIAAQRQNLRQALDLVEARHLDLFQLTKNAVRFPIPQLGLKAVASFLGLSKVSDICDGLEAQSLYGEYRRSQDERTRAAIKMRLIEYNRDDIEALVGVAEGISLLQSSNRDSESGCVG